MRVCHCDNVRMGEPFVPGRDCHPCWLWHHHPEYRAAHGGRAPGPGPCAHLGAPTGESRPCASCNRTLEVPLRSCARHALCTESVLLPGVQCCRICPDREAAPPAARVRRSTLALVTLNLGGVLHPKSRESLAHAAKRWKADFVEVTQPIQNVGGRPHWQKTFLCDWAAQQGYGRVVYIDADTLIRSDCPSLFELVPEETVGVVSNDQIDGVLWRPGPRNRYHDSLAWWARKLGMRCPPLHEHANSGMIVFTPRLHGPLFDAWREAGRSVGWGAPTRLIDQAAFSVLLHNLHTDQSRTWLPMQFNTLVYRHELINASGRMQTFVYHYTGHRKSKLHETHWDLGAPKAPARPAPAPARRHAPSPRLLGPGVDTKALFGRVAVVNLSRRRDRLAEFAAGLPRPWPFGPVQRVKAVDSRLCPPPDWFAHAPGQWGCRQSHLRVLEDALNDGVESLLVFEDDAEFRPDFVARLKVFLAHVPDDWEVLFLGGTHTSGERHRVNGHVVYPAYTTLAHAYALRRGAMQALYTHAHKYTPQRAEFDHRLGDYAGLGVVGVYAPNEWLVWQRQGHSDLTGTSRPRRGL